MKKLITFAFLFVTPLAFSQESRRLVNFLETINRDMNRPVKNQCEGQDEELLKAHNQCAIDLCGKPEEHVSGAITEKNFSLYIDEEVKEHKPLVDKLAAEIFEKEKARVKTMSDVFAARVKSEGFPNYDKWKEEEISSMAAHLWYGNVHIEADRTKPLAERIKVDIEYPENSSPTIKAAIDEYAKARLDNNKMFPSSITNEILTEEEAKEEYFNQIKMLLSVVDEARKTQPHFLSWMNDEFEKYRKLKPEEVTYQNIKDDAFTLSWRIESTTREAKIPNPIAPVKSCGDKCSAGVKEFVTAHDFNLMSKKLAQKVEELDVETAKAECLAELVDKGMKQSDKESFLKNFPKMKKDFLDRSMANSSEHSRKAFEKYIDEEVNLSFAKHAKEDLKKFLDELQKKATEKLWDPEYAKQSDQFLIGQIFNQRDYEDKSEMNPQVSVCFEGGGGTIWDAFAPKEYIQNPQNDEDPTKDNIYVSLFSCTHQSHGKGIISHEMGHALSYAMEKKKLSESSEIAFMETRKCVTSSVVGAKESEGLLNRPGDSIYTEEDMADVLSYQATVDEKPLFLCALLDTNDEETQYADLSIPNQHPEDPHSSPLLRAIREAIYKKRRISPSCQKLIDHHKAEYRFETCL